MDGAIGWVSSVMAAYSVYPISVIKSNFQVKRFRGESPTAVSVIQDIYRSRKVYGFYRGSVRV